VARWFLAGVCSHRGVAGLGALVRGSSRLPARTSFRVWTISCLFVERIDELVRRPTATATGSVLGPSVGAWRLEFSCICHGGTGIENPAAPAAPNGPRRGAAEHDGGENHTANPASGASLFR